MKAWEVANNIFGKIRVRRLGVPSHRRMFVVPWGVSSPLCCRITRTS